jgi:hypothetical protein
MLAATGFAVPDIAWLYFALAQPLAKRLSNDR